MTGKEERVTAHFHSFQWWITLVSWWGLMGGLLACLFWRRLCGPHRHQRSPTMLNPKVKSDQSVCQLTSLRWDSPEINLKPVPPSICIREIDECHIKHFHHLLSVWTYSHFLEVISTCPDTTLYWHCDSHLNCIINVVPREFTCWLQFVVF